MIRFTQWLISLRQQYPILRHGRFLHGRAMSDDGVKDITWLSPAGTEMTEEQWRDGNARCTGLMLNERAVGRASEATVLLILMNAHTDPVRFTLPPLSFGTDWQKIIDTADESGSETSPAPAQIDVAGHSLNLLVRLP